MTPTRFASRFPLMFLPWLMVATVGAAAPTLAPDAEPGRLTPPESPAPRINGAKVFGVRPGSPVLFQVAVSGERPMRFAATGLPAGVTLDAATGRLSGVTAQRGEHALVVTATNARGSATVKLKLVVGDRIALTPPMGWNSWYCFSEAVSAEHIADMARTMHDNGLVHYGWSYVNIDDCWNAETRDAAGAMRPNERFPDMPGLVEKIHGYGLKAGIYSTPWMASYAGFLGGTMPDASGHYAKGAIPAEKRHQPGQIFGDYAKARAAGLTRVGPEWRFDRDMKRYAEWEFDFIKVDWTPIDVPTLRRISADVRAQKRDIVLSLSNAATRKHADDYAKLAELWRISGDITDNWNSVANIGFKQTPGWAAVSRPGAWNDPDMLQVGHVGGAGKRGEMRPTRLTPNEQYAQVALWAVQASPMILSCDLRKLDDFTLGLLTNPEVIAVNQDELGLAGAKHELSPTLTVFVKPLVDGSSAVAVFNRADRAADISVDLAKLGLAGRRTVRDLWRCADEPAVDGALTARIGRHGVKFVALAPAK